MMAAAEFRGDEFIYAVTIAGEATSPSRPFNQTGGTTTIEREAIEMSSKDKSGVAPGANKTQTVSLEGTLTQGDPFIQFMEDAINNGDFVEIYEINTRTLEAKKGQYVPTSFEREFSNGEFATYSLEASLDGNITSETLATVPTGAGTP